MVTNEFLLDSCPRRIPAKNGYGQKAAVDDILDVLGCGESDEEALTHHDKNLTKVEAERSLINESSCDK